MAIAVWVSAPGALAEVEIEDLGSAAANARYATLIDELRCPQCQNQNLAASNAPIAGDLRAQVRRLLREGKSDAEIAALRAEDVL